MTISEILHIHALRYPKMQPTDAIKLIYQNEFGVGHLITDSGLFMQRLSDEMQSAGQFAEIPLTEPIGNGLLRVMLNSGTTGLPALQRLAELCLRTAAAHHGNMDRFLEKIEVLRAETRNGLFGFTSDTLDEYLRGYEQSGFPPVSHSEIYRTAYHPAYRVVLAMFFMK